MRVNGGMTRMVDSSGYIPDFLKDILYILYNIQGAHSGEKPGCKQDTALCT
jgi:hypothetical protein